MNSYTIFADLTTAELKAWLIKNGSPKAAKTVKPSAEYKSEFVVEGNVSVLSILGVFGQLDLRYTWKAIGDSIPLTVYDADHGMKARTK